MTNENKDENNDLDNSEIQENDSKDFSQELESSYHFPKKTKLKTDFFKRNERLLIVGKTRMGKTYLLRKIIKWIKPRPLIVIHDVKREYSDLPELTEKIILKDGSKGMYRITTLDYEGVEIDDPYYVSEYICRNLFMRGNCLLIQEEVAEYIPKMGKLYDVAYNFARYLQQGQVRNCGLICTSQRPAEVHSNIMSQSQHIISFFMKLELDQKALRNYFDPQLFKYLDKYQFLRYSDPDEIHAHLRIY